MPGTRVTYDIEIPAELQDGIVRQVEENVDILPAWCLSLYVLWDTEQEPGCAAAVEPNLAYRRAALRIGPKWPQNTDPYRREIIVHEFLHAHDWPLVKLLHDMADMLEKNYDAPVLAARLRDEIATAREQATTDLTELVVRLLKRGDNAASVDVGALSPEFTGQHGPTIEHGRPEAR